MSSVIVISLDSLRQLMSVHPPKLLEEFMIPIIIADYSALHPQPEQRATHSESLKPSTVKYATLARDVEAPQINKKPALRVVWFDESFPKPTINSREVNQEYYTMAFKCATIDMKKPVFSFKMDRDHTSPSGGVPAIRKKAQDAQFHQRPAPDNVTYHLWKIADLYFLVMSSECDAFIPNNGSPSFVSLLSKVHYQAEQGFEATTSQDLIDYWLRMTFLDYASIAVAHVNVFDNSPMILEKLTSQDRASVEQKLPVDYSLSFVHHLCSKLLHRPTSNKNSAFLFQTATVEEDLLPEHQPLSSETLFVEHNQSGQTHVKIWALCEEDSQVATMNLRAYKSKIDLFQTPYLHVIEEHTKDKAAYTFPIEPHMKYGDWRCEFCGFCLNRGHRQFCRKCGSSKSEFL